MLIIKIFNCKKFRILLNPFCLSLWQIKVFPSKGLNVFVLTLKLLILAQIFSPLSSNWKNKEVQIAEFLIVRIMGENIYLIILTHTENSLKSVYLSTDIHVHLTCSAMLQFKAWKAHRVNKLQNDNFLCRPNYGVFFTPFFLPEFRKPFDQS